MDLPLKSSRFLSTDPRVASEASSPEVSVVLPVQNETDTLEACLTKSHRALCKHNTEAFPKIWVDLLEVPSIDTEGRQMQTPNSPLIKRERNLVKWATVIVI